MQITVNLSIIFLFEDGFVKINTIGQKKLENFAFSNLALITNYILPYAQLV